jgi:hypothetical protein
MFVDKRAIYFPSNRLRSVEQAIGLMKNLQTSIVVEETWVEKQTEKLQSLPTATSARELDVSTQNGFSFRFFLL